MKTYNNYDEKVIDGVIHYKIMPGGAWIKMNLEELTMIIIEQKEKIESLEKQYWLGDYNESKNDWNDQV